MEELVKLKKLESLSLYGRFTNEDLKKLSDIKGLKHFVLNNTIEGDSSRDEYDFIGGYTELQSLVLSKNDLINEMILTRLTDLTYLDIDEASFNNGKKSLEVLKKLTYVAD